MGVLVVGVGALGGVLGARWIAGGATRVAFAVRDDRAAAELRAHGLRVDGVGGSVGVGGEQLDVKPLAAWRGSSFELVVLATKADDAIAAAPRCLELLSPDGVLLPIQNGAVAHELANARVVGGLSNLGATMHALGRYEQRNDGHLLIGELAGGDSERVRRVAGSIRARTTTNMLGAMWSKLLLNCSVTTIGAIAALTMRAYIARDAGRALFERAYAEALSVALATGVRPEKMLVEPIPPHGDAACESWLASVVASYGDVVPSMQQDFERGRPTEIAYINGYVVRAGRTAGIATPINAAIVATVEAISRGDTRPSFAHVERLAVL